MTNNELRVLATGPLQGGLALRPLPEDAVEVLLDVDAPPRLVAHLRAVHDVAVALALAMKRTWPALQLALGDVAFGAATHDIGKAVHVEELREAGHLHEECGCQLLISRGIPARLARFARNHSAPALAQPTLEDLLVTVADKVWKGKREEELESRLVAVLAESTSLPEWKVYAKVDEILTYLAEDADARMQFQNSFAPNR